MTDNQYRILPFAGTENPREVAEVVNNTMRGKINCTFSVTLTAGTSSTVANALVGPDSFIGITPTNAAAAALSPYISSRGKQTFDLTHGTAAGTESYVYVVIG